MRANGYKRECHARPMAEPAVDTRTIEERLLAIVESQLSLQAGDDNYIQCIDLWRPSAELITWAHKHGDATSWQDNQYKPGRGIMSIRNAALFAKFDRYELCDVRVWDCPRPPPRESAPLPTCGECGSVVCEMSGGECVAARAN